MVSRHHKRAQRHLATASYPCSPWFERRRASSWPPKPLPTRFPVLTFDRSCSSLFSRGYATSRRRSGAHTFVVNGGAKPKKKGRSLKRACLPMAPVLVVRPERRFRHVPLQGQLHSTRPDAPEKQLVSPEDPIGIRPEVAIAAPRNAGCTKRTWRDVRPESAFGGKAEVGLRGRQGSF